MLSTGHLVFIHLHKSGGTFINQLLLRHGTDTRVIGYHLPYRELPPELRALPVLGAVRDPLGYYVSWYHFQAGMPRPNPLFLICSDGGRLGFVATIRNLVWLEQDDVRLSQFEQCVPDTFQSRGLNFTKRCVRELRGSGLGFYSYLFLRMFSGSDAPHLLRTERIRQELQPMLERLGEPLSPAALNFIRKAPNLNTSRHGDVEDYYDATLRADIDRRDAKIFDIKRNLTQA